MKKAWMVSYSGDIELVTLFFHADSVEKIGVDVISVDNVDIIINGEDVEIEEIGPMGRDEFIRSYGVGEV